MYNKVCNMFSGALSFNLETPSNKNSNKLIIDKATTLATQALSKINQQLRREKSIYSTDSLSKVTRYIYQVTIGEYEMAVEG